MEGHVDRRRSLVVVLHFRFRQRRSAVGAPVNRLGAFQQVAVADDLAQRADDVGFGFEVHGQVWAIPVAQHAQADEVLLLAFNLLGRVLAALLTEFGRRQLLARFAVQLFNLQFDRQAVAVPTRHIRRVEAGHPFRLDDNVFENLVNRVTNVNAAVRIRRAVMQNEGFFALFGSTNNPVQILFIPTLQHARFALGEIAAHREPCFRQVQGILVVTH